LIVELSKDEVRVCTQLATERWLTKFSSVDRPNYAAGKAAGRLEHELLANVRANISEWAVAKVYNIAWNVPWYPNEFHWARAGLPDVGTRGEVRTVRTANAIPFWTKDLDKTIFGTKIIDEEYYTQVNVYGWFLPSQYQVDAYRDESISGWRVPIELLKEKE
jgi:hypothetical protein